jgi:F420-dependent oxidoreductase-like protein
VRLNVHLSRYPWPGEPSEIAPGLVRTAKAAEAVGASGLSLGDHFFGRGSVVGLPLLEGYTVLGFLAAVTRSLQLRLLVTGVTYRHPGILLKSVTALDVLSGGRGELGIGAAWFAREHHGLGVPFPGAGERLERLEETLQIALQMWSDNEGPFMGKHYQLMETICVPPPISRPHPRIIVGGMGEQKTLALVARYADACNLHSANPKVVARKLEVLRRHCDTVGRDYEEIGKTIVGGNDLLSDGRYGEFVRLMDQLGALGVEEVSVVPRGNRPERWIHRHLPAVIPDL